MASLD
jgi:hypothetical protein